MRRLTIRIAVLTATSLLGACSMLKLGHSCEDPELYQAAQSAPTLKVPEGLNAPATRGALKIPDVEPTARPRAKGDPCLDEPPSFYPGRPKPGAPGSTPTRPQVGDKSEIPAQPGSATAPGRSGDGSAPAPAAPK